jgi:hypothetical protein
LGAKLQGLATPRKIYTKEEHEMITPSPHSLDDMGGFDDNKYP